MIKAVFFDFDGTLVDTNPLIIRTFNETFANLLPDRTLSDSEILDCIGPTLQQTGEKYFPGRVQEFVDHYRELNLAYHDDMVEIYKGIVEMLEALQQMGLHLAVVSSKKRDVVLRGMRLLDLEKYFDFILAGDEVTYPKPHQEPVELALKRFGLKPSEAVMVGDNSHDIHSAQNAGVISVGVGWAYKGADYLKKFSPDYIIKDADELIKLIEVTNNGKINL